MPSNPALRITEIFLSIQGEASSVGYPTVFVRLTGCPLRCHYCDSEYAFEGGKQITLNDIVEQVAAFRLAFQEDLALRMAFRTASRLRQVAAFRKYSARCHW